MPSETRYRATYARPQLVRKSERVSTSGMWSKAVLTFPLTDLAGDYVVPTGLAFAEHIADPSIDLEHGRTPDVRGMPVAWARESLSEPGAPYAVEFKSLNCADEGKPAEFHDLPVGTSYFDPSCRVSTQVFALVEQDALPAVSLEFRPVAGFFKALGQSPLEARPAYHFDRADVVRWTICARGVNPGALALQKSLPQAGQVPDALCKILQDRRVNVGGKWEPLHGVILKALSVHQAPPAKTTVRVEKGMNDDALDTANQAAVMDDTTAPTDEAPALGGVSAKYKFAQAIELAVDDYLADMQSSDSPELRKAAEKFAEMGKALAEKVKGMADKHDAKLNGGADTDLNPETGETSESAESAAEPVDMEKDDEGTYKAVRAPYKSILKALRAKRFKLADVESTTEPAPVQKAPATLEDELADIEKNDPAGWALIQREMRRAEKLNP